MAQSYPGSSRRSSQEAFPSSLFYDTNIEIFIALRDVDYTYYLDDTKRVVPCLKKIDRYVTVYTQPVGALRDVEKCRTEVLYRNKNPSFVTKVNLDFDFQDLPAIFLNCKVSYWEAVKVSVQRVVQAGPKGLDVPLKLKFEYNQTDVHNAFTDFACSEVVPGRLFLRAEIFQPIYKGVVLQFRLSKGRYGSSKNRFLEFSKLNEGDLFDPATAFPYTLIHRTEPRGGSAKEAVWCPNYFFVNSICNGDYDRVLKIEVHKADCKDRPPHFVLTTLGHVVKAKTLKSPLTSSFDGSIDKTSELVLDLIKEVQLNSFEYYFSDSRRMSLRRIYAVDFSNSNWRINLHKFHLHSPRPNGLTIYEETLQVIAESTHPYSEQSGDAVFYSFGNPKMEPFVSTFPYPGHVKSLTAIYGEALLSCKISEATISSTKVMPPTTEARESTSRQSPFACFPTPCNRICLQDIKGTQLGPLLRDILSLLMSEQSPHLHYNTVYILTDGQITDIPDATEIIFRLSTFPVSLIFIGIGSGEFKALQELEYSWLVAQKGTYSLRKIVHLIYFRSLTEWNSAIQFAKYKSSPFSILCKEIFTVIRNHCLTYLRLYRPDI